MLFSKQTLVAAMAFSSLVGAAVSQPLHGHNVHKREAAPAVVTVFVTEYRNADGSIVHATVPAGNDVAAAVETVAAPAPPAPEPKKEEAPAPAPPAPASSSAAAPKKEEEAPKSNSVAPPPSSGGFNGGAKGVVYSPYKVGGCKTADEVKSDLAKLSGFEVIRLYGTDCDQISNVKAALAPGQKLFLGIFNMGSLESDLQSLISAVNGDWSVVHTVSIGNELVNNGAATVGQIADYLSRARPILSKAGYTGPVVSVDTFIAVINNPGLCELSDYIACNAHAYFDGHIASQDAGKWTLEQIQRVWTACGGKKDVFIAETGWPHAGEPNGKAHASPADQSAALQSIKSAAGDSCILFTAFDDYWKAPGMYSIEQSFGFLN